jgi:hypothetical protein
MNDLIVLTRCGGFDLTFYFAEAMLHLLDVAL